MELTYDHILTFRDRETRSQMKRTNKRIIHSIAHCNECQAEWDGYSAKEEGITSARWATKHARMTSHNVSVEQGVVYQVLGRSK